MLNVKTTAAMSLALIIVVLTTEAAWELALATFCISNALPLLDRDDRPNNQAWSGGVSCTRRAIYPKSGS